MKREFEMSMLGEFSFFIGLHISQSNKGIFISQTKYIKETMNKFTMEDYPPVGTPMVTVCKLSKEDDSKEANQTLYRSMIRSLLYIIASRIDIMKEIGLFGRVQDAPKETHVKTVKRIFRYLKGTLDFGLWYPTGTNFTLTTYTHAYWEGSVDDRNITSVGAFFLVNRLVSWFSKKQSSICLSTVEVEYIVTISCCTQVLWLK
jgi:hypothetical protein